MPEAAPRSAGNLVQCGPRRWVPRQCSGTCCHCSYCFCSFSHRSALWKPSGPRTHSLSYCAIAGIGYPGQSVDVPRCRNDSVSGLGRAVQPVDGVLDAGGCIGAAGPSPLMDIGDTDVRVERAGGLEPPLWPHLARLSTVFGLGHCLRLFAHPPWTRWATSSRTPSCSMRMVTSVGRLIVSIRRGPRGIPG